MSLYEIIWRGADNLPAETREFKAANLDEAWSEATRQHKFPYHPLITINDKSTTWLSFGSKQYSNPHFQRESFSSGAKRSGMANSNSSDQSQEKYIDISSEQRDVIFVPFTPQVSLGSSSMNEISRELRDTVSEYEAKGFEFMRIDTVHVDIRPGCIMAMFGKQSEYHPYEFLVFRKKAS